MKMKGFVTIFAKRSILDIWQGSEYTPSARHTQL